MAVPDRPEQSSCSCSLSSTQSSPGLGHSLHHNVSSVSTWGLWCSVCCTRRKCPTLCCALGMEFTVRAQNIFTDSLLSGHVHSTQGGQRRTAGMGWLGPLARHAWSRYSSVGQTVLSASCLFPCATAREAVHCHSGHPEPSFALGWAGL